MAWDYLNNKLIGILAESWEWTDEVTLRIKLFENITSAAGDPVTADDVLWSLNFCDDIGLTTAFYNLLDLEKTKVVDKHTIDIVAVDSYPYLTLDLCAPVFPIGCEKTAKAIAYNEATGEWDQNKLNWDTSYGTGAYIVVDTDENSWVKMERNDNYWNSTKPYYKYIELTSVTDISTRSMGLEAGDYLVSPKLNSASVMNLENNPDFKVWKNSSLGSVMIFRMNSEVEALRNKELRQAIALAIDYENLSQVVYGGTAEPAYNAMVPTTSGYYVKADENDPNNFIRYDVDAAKQKMIDAGYAGGITFDFKYPTTDTSMTKTAETLQYMLSQIGIKLVMKPLETLAFFDEVRAGRWELCFSGAGNPNPKNNVNKIDPSFSYTATPGWSNNYWYDDIDYLQELCNKCYFTMDENDLMEAWKEIQAITQEYVPMIIMMQPQTITATSSDIVGLTINSYGHETLAWVYPAEYITG